MKITPILVLCLILALPLATAGVDIELVVQAGSKPGDPTYFLDQTFEGIELFFAGKGIGRAAKLSELADERLAEAAVLYEQGSDVEAQEALNDEKMKMTEVDNIVTSPVQPEDIANRLDKFDEINLRLIRRQVILQGIIDRIQSDSNPNNDHALAGLQNALSHSKKVRDTTELLERAADTAVQQNSGIALSQIRSENMKKPTIARKLAEVSTRQNVYDTQLVDDTSTQIRGGN